MYRIAICDDDEKMLKIVERNVQDYCKVKNIGVATTCFVSSGMLVNAIEHEQIFDAYILDVEMPEYSGLDIVEILQEYADRTKIILLTAYTFYAIKACGMQVFRYVTKDKFQEEIPQVLEEMFASLKRLNYDKMYLIENQNRFIKLKQKSIIYICKDQKNSVFFMKDGSVLKERTTLRQVYDKLNNDDMLFLDRSYIINLFHVKAILEQTVELEGGHKIFTSQEHITELKRTISNYWRNRL